MSRRFGATGEFPEGKIDETDEGALEIGVTRHEGNVIINFGTRIAWVGMTPDQAIEFAKLILLHAGALKSH